VVVNWITIASGKRYAIIQYGFGSLEQARPNNQPLTERRVTAIVSSQGFISAGCACNCIYRQSRPGVEKQLSLAGHRIDQNALSLALSYGIYLYMAVAKVFMNGRSQAIRLPKQFRVKGDKVFLTKTSNGFTVLERDPWEIFEEGCRELSDHFMADRTQPSLEKRDWSK